MHNTYWKTERLSHYTPISSSKPDLNRGGGGKWMTRVSCPSPEAGVSRQPHKRILLLALIGVDCWCNYLQKEI